jgi:S1-C subfamily serine protease
MVELRSEDGSTNVIRNQEVFFNEQLGASMSPLSVEELARFNLRSGLKITDIGNGLLSNGGIREDFIITSVNGYAVNSRTALESALEQGSSRARISGIYPNGMRVTYEFGL